MTAIHWPRVPLFPGVASACMAVALAGAGAIAQTRQEAPPLPPTTGTAVVRGRVIDAISNRPIKGAIVTVDGEVQLRRPGFITGADGTFIVRGLPAGMLSVGAAKPGYFDGAHGQQRPAGTRTPVPLDDGELRDDVVVRMWPHGWISGVVSDDAGRPLGGVAVRVVRQRPAGHAFGALEPVIDVSAMTDDQGAYAVSALLPGRYVIGVVPQYGTRDRVAVAAAAASAAAATGRAAGPARPANPFSDVTMSLDAEGRREITIFGVPLLPPDADGRWQVYPATFAAAASLAEDAEVVTLGAGESRDRVDLTLRGVPGAQVGGQVLGPMGPVGDAQVRLIASMVDRQWITASTTTAPDGSFLFALVPRGRYTIEATRMKPGASVAAADPDGLHAEMPLTVDGTLAGPSAIVLTMRAGATVRGQFVFDGDFPAAARARIVAFLDPVAGADVTTAVPPGVPARDVADGFVLTGVPPGRYLAGAVGLPAGWMVTSVLSGGRDVAAAPIEIGASGVSDLTIAITNRVSSIAGVVRGPTGAPTDRASVVIFPADRSLWVSGTRGEHLLRAVRAVGEFAFDAVPPGEYLVAAVDDARMGDWPRAELLSSIAGRATRVSLAAGESKRVEVGTGLFSTDSAVEGTGLRQPSASRPGAALTVLRLPWRLPGAPGPGPLTPPRAPSVAAGGRPARAGLPAGTGGSAGSAAFASAGGLSPFGPNLWKTSPSLSGTVLDDTSAQVAGALVTVADAAGQARLMAATDEAGRFAFGQLPAGQYGIRAARPGYISAAYGQTSPDRPAALVPLAANEDRRDIVLRLVRAAAISGRVLDEDGAPLPGLPARAHRLTRAATGAQTTAFAATAVAGRDGRFRISGLAPGDYLVSAVRPGATQLTQIDARGQTRALMYLESYHPDTHRAGDARAIAVGPGETREGIDVSIRPVPAAAISGVVRVPSSQPLVALSVELRDAGSAGSTRYRAGSFRDSRFSFPAVPAGQYDVIARASAGDPATAAAARGDAPFFLGSAAVSTDGVNPIELTLMLTPASRVIARVTFDATAAPPPDPARPFLVPLRTIPGSSPLALDSSAFATHSAGDGWSIAWTDVAPGRYVLSSHERTGWQLASAIVGGREMLDAPFEVASGADVSSVALVFTDARTELTGTLRTGSGGTGAGAAARAAAGAGTRSGLPSPDAFTIIVFSVDRRHWWQGSRRTQLARPGPTGAFTLRGLPAGEYFIAALPALPPGPFGDTSALELLAATAQRVTLGAGQKQTVEVTVRVPRP